MNNYDLYKNDLGTLLLIAPLVIEKLSMHKQINSKDKEAAGVLVGEKRGNHFVLCDASEPYKRDIRHRYSVNRCDPQHQIFVNNAFITSDKKWQYLGEWHTHPERYPAPSSLDRQSWKNSLKTFTSIILIIIGTESIWIAQKKGTELHIFNKVPKV